MLPIYFINLVSRPNRRSFMEEQFVQLGLPATRIEAVTKLEISASERAAYSDQRRPVYRSLSELACTKSHQRAWEALADAGAPYGLIFEDDAILSSHLPAFLSEFDPTPYDLVRIETLERRIRLIGSDVARCGDVRLRRSISNNNGSAGYIISREYAARLLRHPEVFAIPVDNLLFEPLVVQRDGVRLVHTDPGLCIQIKYASESSAPPTASDVSGPHLTASTMHRLQRFLLNARYEVRSGLNHLRHLPQGVSREVIPFRA